MKTIILRHRRENLKKCSLRGLEHHPDLSFYTYPNASLPDYSGYILLKVGAPILSVEDRDRGLFLIDGTWRLASVMERQLKLDTVARSLPPTIETAYPRRQPDCPDEAAGLASIEALYIAHKILGRSTENILDSYYWKDLFLKKNRF